MKIHPRKLIAAWLMWSLVLMIVTVIATQALAEPERIIEVEYIVLEPEEVEVPEVVVEEPEQVETFPMETLGVFNISAYCPCEECCGPYADGYTSSGAKATEGITIAADPEVLPEGTEIFIDGIGWRTVQDVGGAIKGNRLDLFFQSHQDAEIFGRQYLEVYKEVN